MRVLGLVAALSLQGQGIRLESPDLEALDEPMPQCLDRLRTPEGLDGEEPCSLWPEGGVPGEEELEPMIESRYIMDNGVDRLTNVSTPSLLPFLVNGSDRALIVAPGGGYEILDWNGEGTDVAFWFTGIGINVFLLKYRVPERKHLGFAGAPRIDAQRAMRLVRYRAKDLGIDPNKIGFMGFSAGGHLTAETSTRYEEDFYARMDGADDVSSRPDLAFLLYPWKLLWHNFVKMRINTKTPPSFLAHSHDDVVAPYMNSQRYYDKLQAFGVKSSELNIYETSNIQYGHGYGNCITPRPSYPISSACSWPMFAQLFINKHWK